MGSERDNADWQVILLVGGQPDDSMVHELVDGLAEEAIIDCRHVSIESLTELAPVLLPDLILLMANPLMEEGVDPAELCGKLRVDMETYRPVLSVYGDIGEEQRIACLTEGADDVLSHQLSMSELRVRLLIQLRRNLETVAHPVTRLPGLAFSGKLLQRRMNQEMPWALLLISLDYWQAYMDIYGQLPANQALKALMAILSRSVLIPDFIGQTESNDFLVVTHPDKAVKIATLLCRQFDAAVPNFYSERDRKQGYMISIPVEGVSYRIPFLSLSIGIVTSRTQTQAGFMLAYQAAVMMRNLARYSPGSSWMLDTPQLAGEQIFPSRETQQILLVESDAALAFLLQTTLQMDGYQVDAVSSAKEARAMLEQAAQAPDVQFPYQMVILDALLQGDVYTEDSPDATLSGLALCREVREQYPHTAIVCISTLHQRERVLKAGADLYLPKPFEMGSLFTWVERLMSGLR